MSWALESTVWASLNIFSITSLETIFIFLFRVLVCRIMSIRASLWGWLMLLHQRIQFTLLTILQGAFLEFQLRIAFTLDGFHINIKFAFNFLLKIIMNCL